MQMSRFESTEITGRFLGISIPTTTTLPPSLPPYLPPTGRFDACNGFHGFHSKHGNEYANEPFWRLAKKLLDFGWRRVGGRGREGEGGGRKFESTGIDFKKSPDPSPFPHINPFHGVRSNMQMSMQIFPLPPPPPPSHTHTHSHTQAHTEFLRNIPSATRYANEYANEQLFQGENRREMRKPNSNSNNNNNNNQIKSPNGNGYYANTPTAMQMSMQMSRPT